MVQQKREESGDGLSGGAAGTARKPARSASVHFVEPEGTTALNKRVPPTAAAAAASASGELQPYY